MRVLLVRLSSIGDVVHTLPALAALARAGHEAGWIVEPAARPLLEGHPLINKDVFDAPPARGFALGPARHTVAALRRASFDVALDFQGLWKSAAWARLSGARRRLGFASTFGREPVSAMTYRPIGPCFRSPDGDGAIGSLQRRCGSAGSIAVVLNPSRERRSLSRGTAVTRLHATTVIVHVG